MSVSVYLKRNVYTLDFGFPNGQEGDIARFTVSAPSVQSGSIIFCETLAQDTLDHTADEAIVEGIRAYAENIIPDVGFDIVAVAPNNSWGRYLVAAVQVG